MQVHPDVPLNNILNYFHIWQRLNVRIGGMSLLLNINNDDASKFFEPVD